MILRRPAPPKPAPAVNADAAKNELLMYVQHMETRERKYEARLPTTSATMQSGASK